MPKQAYERLQKRHQTDSARIQLEGTSLLNLLASCENLSALTMDNVDNVGISDIQAVIHALPKLKKENCSFDNTISSKDQLALTNR